MNALSFAALCAKRMPPSAESNVRMSVRPYNS
jgi:hypothetical protein